MNFREIFFVFRVSLLLLGFSCLLACWASLFLGFAMLHILFKLFGSRYSLTYWLLRLLRLLPSGYTDAFWISHFPWLRTFLQLILVSENGNLFHKLRLISVSLIQYIFSYLISEHADAVYFIFRLSLNSL